MTRKKKVQIFAVAATVLAVILIIVILLNQGPKDSDRDGYPDSEDAAPNDPDVWRTGLKITSWHWSLDPTGESVNFTVTITNVGTIAYSDRIDFRIACIHGDNPGFIDEFRLDPGETQTYQKTVMLHSTHTMDQIVNVVTLLYYSDYFIPASQ